MAKKKRVYDPNEPKIGSMNFTIDVTRAFDKVDDKKKIIISLVEDIRREFSDFILHVEVKF
jgi:hypothetical protein